MHSSPSPVAVTGLGARCSVAADVPRLDTALRAGTSGVRERTVDEQPLSIAALMPPGDGALPPGHTPEDPRLRRLLKRSRPAVVHSLAAAFEAAHQARLDDIEDRRRVAVVLAGDVLVAGSTFDMHERYTRSADLVRPGHAYQMWNSYLLGCVSEFLQILGEGSTVSAASASGNVGLLTGARLLRADEADVCLVLSAMHDLSPVETHAFSALGALAPAGDLQAGEIMRPFDRRHRGFVLGEGAAAIVLERAEHAVAREIPILAHVLGGATVLDGHHQTQPSLDGETSVMREALRRSDRQATDVDLVSAHGTSTPLGDETEAAAIGGVFGDRTLVNATKSMLGHCLGAASGLSAIACVLQLQGQYVHPNVNLEDPVRPLNFAPSHPKDSPLRTIVNNAFAFGGINTSIVFGAGD